MKILTISACAGISSFSSPHCEYEDLELDLNDIIIDNPSATYLTKVSGDSMVDAGIANGDILVIDRSVTPKTGDVIAAIFRGEFVCKYIDIENHLLLSANNLHEPVRITEDDEFSNEGVCIRSIHFFRSSPVLFR